MQYGNMVSTWDVGDNGFGASGYEDVLCSVGLISDFHISWTYELCVTFDILHVILSGERKESC